MHPRLQTIIIDDEAPGRTNLGRMLEEYCPRLEVTGSFGSAGEARHWLNDHPAQAVFLDICMPNENGFDFIRSFDEIPFSIVFVTAYQEYALKAIKASAVDYVLKPFLPADLREAEARLLKQVTTPGEWLQAMDENLKRDYPEKIIAYHSKGFNIVDPATIIRIEADGNYSTIFCTGAAPLVVSRPIGEFELLLHPAYFVRIHKSHLVHLRYIEQYVFEDGGYVVLSDGHRAHVSRRRSAFLFDRLSRFTDLRPNYKR